ncbi:MAG: hypothetical protein V1746_00435 [bacterium]
MKKFIFILFWSMASVAWAQPNVQVIAEDNALTSFGQPMQEEDSRFVTPPPMPLTSYEPINIMMAPATPLPSSSAIRFAPPEAVPLISLEAPHLVPTVSVPLNPYDSALISQRPSDSKYRVISVSLSDFAVAMSRRSGLNYIFNPGVKGTVNGYFRDTDPLHMLRVAAEAHGYKLNIRDGVDVELLRRSQ